MSNGDEEEPDSKKPVKKGKKKPGVEIGDDMESDGDPTKKPRIKIKVKGVQGTMQKVAKRKRKTESDDDETISAGRPESDTASLPKSSKKRKLIHGKATVTKKSTVAKASDSSSDDDIPLREVAAKSKRKSVATEAKQNDAESVFLDLDFWNSARELLDGSFKSARKSFLQCGPWKLPPGIPDDKFSEVAYITLDKMHK